MDVMGLSQLQTAHNSFCTLPGRFPEIFKFVIKDLMECKDLPVYSDTAMKPVAVKNPTGRSGC